MQRRDAGSVLHKADDRKLGSPAYNCCWVLPVARPRSSPELGVRARASRPTDLVVAALGGSAAISSVTRETVRDGAMTDPTTRTSAPTAGRQCSAAGPEQFVADSAVEQAGFELSVPLATGVHGQVAEACR